MANRILIVDGDAVQRRLPEAMVVKLGHECETADGGEPALARPKGPRFDAVILDLVKPASSAPRGPCASISA
jgi:CheY-like chemotaxis protein